MLLNTSFSGSFTYSFILRLLLLSVHITRVRWVSKLEFFQLLWHEKYEVYQRQFPDHLLTKLKEFYASLSLFDYIRLKNELVLYSSPEFADKNVHELVEFMVKNGLNSGF